MYSTIIHTLLTLWSWTRPSENHLCRISDYGAAPNQTEYSTPYIQAAIDDCTQHENSRVLFDQPGTYLSASLEISTPRGITIEIPSGVTLLAGNRRQDYPGGQEDWYLLRFIDCHGCALTGGGTVDGQSELWVLGSQPDRKVVANFEDPSCRSSDECRPRLVGFISSTNCFIQDISLVNAIYWTLHILNSSTITINSINIVGDWDVPNNDGIDIDGSTDVSITNSHIDTADDAVCIKTTRPWIPTRRISLTNSWLRSRSSAFKIGSESRANISDITVSNVEIHESHRGLAIQLRDEGSVTSIVFRDIKMSTQYYDATWWGESEPIYITAIPREEGSIVGSVAGITLENITVTSSENGVFISGSHYNWIEDVLIVDLSIEMKNMTSWPGGAQDYRPSYLGLQQSGSTAAVFMAYARDVLLYHVEAVYHEPRRPDWNQVLQIDAKTTEGIDMQECRFYNASSLAVA